jgi:hypothetical protein
MVQKPLTLTYDGLTSQFTPHSVVATLAFAGNRRPELLKAPDTRQGPVGPPGDLDRRMAWSQAGRRPRRSRSRP